MSEDVKSARDEPVEWGRVASVLVGCAVLIVATGGVAFATRPCDDDTVCQGLDEWLDQDTSAKSVAVGMAAGVAFGLIDNLLLWLGMSAMDTALARMPGGGSPLALAGYGNAFSSVVSAFVSTFVGRFLANVYHVDVSRAPLWSMAIGLLAGCLMGAAIPRALKQA